MPCLPSRTLGKARGGRGGEKGALLPGEGPSKQPTLFFSLAYMYATVWRFDGLASPGNRSLPRCIAPLHDATRAQSSVPEREGAVDHHLARHGVATQHGMNRLECGTAARHGRWSSQSWFFCFILLFLPHSDTVAGTPGWEAGKGHEFAAVVEYVCGPSRRASRS